MNQVLGFSSLLLAAVSFGSFGIWIRLLNNYLTPYQQIVLRNIFAFIISLLIIIIWKRWRFSISGFDWIKTALYSVAIPISVLLFNFSVLNTKISISTSAFYSGSIIVSSLLGAVIFKEKLTKKGISSLVLSIIGLLLFSYPQREGLPIVGLILGLLSGFADSIANVFRKELPQKIDKLILLLLTAVGGVVVSGVMGFFSSEGLIPLTGIPVIATIICVIFGALLVLNNYLLLLGFQNFKLGIGVIVLSAEIVFATIFGFAFFREIPSTNEILGGALVLLAIIIPNLKTK